jgi:hypothetical protein
MFLKSPKSFFYWIQKENYIYDKIIKTGWMIYDSLEICD